MMSVKDVNCFYPAKKVLSSLYGMMEGRSGGYVFWKGFRGAGRLYAAAQRVGYDELLGKLIRIRLRYPLWYEGDDLIRELQMKLWIIQNRGGGS